MFVSHYEDSIEVGFTYAIVNSDGSVSLMHAEYRELFGTQYIVLPNGRFFLNFSSFVMWADYQKK